MAQAKRVKDLPEVQAKRESRLARKASLRAFSESTFEELSEKDKKDLLKLLAVQLGLVKPS